MGTSLFGILNVNKPVGLTSRDVVNRIQRLVRPNKIGHAGTLDPLASGVLLVCLGRATRLVPYLQQPPKCYTGTFLLGRTSDTEDTQGTVTELDPQVRPDREAVEGQLPRFRGRILQRPPSFSALKVQGRRAYELARRGESVSLAARPIHIHRLEIAAYAYPELTLDITCSSGTYIRSLGRDLARSLGTGAVMSALVRTSIGSFHLSQACGLDQLTVTSSAIASRLQPALRAVEHLPRITLGALETDSVLHGRGIERTGCSTDGENLAADGQVAAVDGIGRLIAILVPKSGDLWKPVRTFPRPEDPS